MTDAPVPRDHVGDVRTEELSVPVECGVRVVHADVRGDDLGHGGAPVWFGSAHGTAGGSSGHVDGDPLGCDAEGALHTRPQAGCEQRVDALVADRGELLEGVGGLGHDTPP